ncbi:MAG TPA: hypothetical protein VF395_18615, partial [Polyangiaceae bacterium]
ARLDSNYFTDDTCGVTVALTAFCDPPSLVEGPPPPDPGGPLLQPSCSPQTIYGALATTTRVPSNLVYSTAEGPCAPTKYGGFEYYKANSPVRFVDYPPIETVHEGAGRLQPAFWVSEGKRLYAEGLYDTTFGNGCGPAVAGSATVCQSNNPYGSIGQYFADPGCTAPLYASSESVPGCPTTVPQIVASDTGPGVAACEQAAYSVRHVLKVHAGPVYTTGGFLGPFPPNPGPDTCTLDTSLPPPKTYDLGPLVGAAQAFAPLTATDF